MTSDDLKQDELHVIFTCRVTVGISGLGDRDCRPVERPTFLQRVAVEVVHVRFAEDGGAVRDGPAPVRMPRLGRRAARF